MASRAFVAAKSRFVLEEGRFPVASLDDIIASERATGMEKDLANLGGLEIPQRIASCHGA